MAYKQKRSMIAGTDPVKKARAKVGAPNMKDGSYKQGFEKGGAPKKQDTDPRKSPEARKKAAKEIKELENRPDFKKNELLGMIDDIKFSAEGRSLTDSEKKQIANLEAQIAAL